jgi:Domain of unknown function (DUF1707)
VASPDYRYDPDYGPHDRSLRVGEKERDAVGEILRQAHLDGRLDSDEFQARLDRSMAAKTYAELDDLIADLPREENAARRPGRRGSPRLWPLAFPLLPLAVIAAIVVGGHFVWLAIPLFLFFVVRPLAWRPWGTGYARGGWGCGPPRMRA